MAGEHGRGKFVVEGSSTRSCEPNELSDRYGTNAVEIMLQSRLLMAGERLVAHVDVKADRARGRPLGKLLHHEPDAPPEIAEALRAELAILADRLGLAEVASLASTVRAATSTEGSASNPCLAAGPGVPAEAPACMNLSVIHHSTCRNPLTTASGSLTPRPFGPAVCPCRCG